MTHPGEITPTFALATELTDAHDVALETLDRQWYDRWSDEDEDWLVVLNGVSTPWYTKATPASEDHFDDPFVAKVPPGCAFVMVDDEAIAVIHPTHNEFYTRPKATRAWERALLNALHGRLVALEADVPPLEDVVDERPDATIPTPN